MGSFLVEIDQAQSITDARRAWDGRCGEKAPKPPKPQGVSMASFTCLDKFLQEKHYHVNQAFSEDSRDLIQISANNNGSLMFSPRPKHGSNPWDCQWPRHD